MASNILPFLLLLFLAPNAIDGGKTVHYKISGTIKCVDKPMAGQGVLLMEEDTPALGDKDDTLGGAITDSEGHFYVEGTENENGENEPYLYIEHSCNTDKLIGSRAPLDHFQEVQNVEIVLNGQKGTGVRVNSG